MDANELLKKVRKIEIKTKGLSQNIFAGEYHSAFKGRGMRFRGCLLSMCRVAATSVPWARTSEK